MLASLNRLREVCKSRDAGRLVMTLKEIVVDYNPSVHLLKRVIGGTGNRMHESASARRMLRKRRIPLKPFIEDGE